MATANSTSNPRSDVTPIRRGLDDASLEKTRAAALASVEQAIAEVRSDLAARRSRGELPELPTNELNLQFNAVIESVEGGISEQPPIDTTELRALSHLDIWRPFANRSPRRRAVGKLISPFSRAVGIVVRNQAAAYTHRTAKVVTELAERQNRIQFFLERTHLDRVRRLEYRIAQLEREVERLTAERSSEV
jgi:hypothetical protein